MSGVLFVVMPFCGVERPQIGVSTLKTALLQRGIPCEIAYLNIPFAESLGFETYGWITNNYSYEVFAGEWVFAREMFSDSEIHHQQYVDEILVRYGAFDREKLDRVSRMAQLVPPFLDYCMRAVDWERYSIVGFTSTFEQNLPSLLLAKKLKERYPKMIIAMGGGNCGGEMGLQLHKSFPFLDYVFTGEADETFPVLAQRISYGNSNCSDLKGFVYRDGTRSVDLGSAPLARDLDALPYPNYDDFFDQFRASRLPREVAPCLQIETARGCWWGAKQHCTFCGLNRDEMAFRAKSPERAVDEIQHLVARYGTTFVSAVDNIIAMPYFKSVLPELKRRKLGVNFFYETKSNLKKDQVQLLRDAGVDVIQPGIESLSQNVLQLMRKGVTPLQNIQLLKWCGEFGVDPKWNMLYGFPGENYRDYKEIYDLVLGLTHLPPPGGFGSVRLDRFSPYFDFPERFGIRGLRALKPYRHLYPFDDDVLYNLAYFFEYDFDGKEKKDRWFEPLRREIELWKQHHSQSRLESVSNNGHEMVVRDTRPHRTHNEYRFRSPEKLVLEFCDEIRRFDDILEHVCASANGSAPDEPTLRKFVEYLVNNRLMLEMNDRYVSLVMPAKPVARRKPVEATAATY